MASYFGEVTDLSSRAVEDSDSEKVPSQQFTFEVRKNTRLCCDYVIFAVGKMATAFISSHFLTPKSELFALARLFPAPGKTDSSSGLDYKTKPRIIAKGYASPDNMKVLICEVDDSVPENLNVNLCATLTTVCSKDAEFVVLMTSHTSRHKSNDRGPDEESFLRCLVTSKYKQKYSTPNIPYLKSPNVISNFPAAALTQFEVQKRVAIMSVCYTDVPEVDSKTVGVFDSVLDLPLVKEKIPKNSAADATIKLEQFVKRNCSREDNLYI